MQLYILLYKPEYPAIPPQLPPCTVPVFRQFITFKVLILPTIPPTFILPTIAPLFEQFIMYLLLSEIPTIPPT